MRFRLGAFIVFVASAATAGASGSPASERDGLLVLLADNRILRLSPSGKVVAERRLAPAPARAMEAGRALALAPRGDAAYALLRRGARDELVLVDVRTLDVRHTIPLERGIRYRGVLVGPRSRRIYLYGNRPGRVVDRSTGLRAQSAVVTFFAPSGKRILTRIVRGSRWQNWWVYWGALALNERRLYLSYHGGCARDPAPCTTGADWIEIAGASLRSCTASEGPTGNVGCIEEPHGIVEPFAKGRLLAASGEAGILRLDSAGNVLQTHRRVSTDTHLMDFALDRSRQLVYTSSCDGTIRRLALASGAVRTLARDVDCGIRTVLGARSTLAIATATSGYPGAALEATVALVSRTTGNVIALLPLIASPLDMIAVE